MLMLMKLTFLLTVLFVGTLHASVNAQTRLTMNLGETNLKEVFNEIQRQTQKTVVYNNERLDLDRVIEADFNDEALEDILDKVLSGSGMGYKFTNDYIVIVPQEEPALPQAVEEQVIQGVVKDENGQPLPGVTVLLKGTTLGTATDAEGKWKLVLPANVQNPVFIFSFVGMETQEIAYTGQEAIDVTLLAEAAEMATFGAKVLHPATLLPAVRSDIPVFVGSSKDPRAGGTLVCNKTENPPLFRALALRRNQTLLTLHSLNMLHSRGFLAEVFGILARHNISVDLITTSEVSVALTLDTTGSTSTGDTLLTQSLLMELSALCRVEVEEGLALVALIGNDLSKACGVGKEVFGVLEPFNIRMICYGASSHNLGFLVPGEDAEQVVQKLHFNLFE